MAETQSLPRAGMLPLLLELHTTCYYGKTNHRVCYEMIVHFLRRTKQMWAERGGVGPDKCLLSE